MYLVIGTYWGENDSYTMVSNYAVHESLEGAKEELKNILDEIIEEARKNNYTFHSVYSDEEEDEIALNVIYETGSEEMYKIYERKVLR